MPVKIVRSHSGLQRLFQNPSGGTARMLSRKAIRVTNRAKENATGRPVAGALNPEGRGPRVDTGRLRSSISWNLLHDADSVYARVGTNVIYGFWLETGLRNGATYPFLVPALPAALG